MKDSFFINFFYGYIFSYLLANFRKEIFSNHVDHNYTHNYSTENILTNHNIPLHLKLKLKTYEKNIKGKMSHIPFFCLNVNQTLKLSKLA